MHNAYSKLSIRKYLAPRTVIRNAQFNWGIKVTFHAFIILHYLNMGIYKKSCKVLKCILKNIRHAYSKLSIRKYLAPRTVIRNAHFNWGI